MTNTNMTARAICGIWRRLPVGAGRLLEPLQDQTTVIQSFPGATRIAINPHSIRQRLSKPEKSSRARRRRFFLKDEGGWLQTDFRKSYQYQLIQDI
ncbi:hypothetical protein M911_01675 [Ectothiorhodospira haloalkaliphila]|uniref:Uncharacterized protein n=1 Tax=Ectothiorhodospira haloalkaliphila TaxID=421628 RepID=W8KN23_9GAMM|nr:hypothetical protein M911_01675 [Ectothiorhodospira haloalkaliphila]